MKKKGLTMRNWQARTGIRLRYICAFVLFIIVIIYFLNGNSGNNDLETSGPGRPVFQYADTQEMAALTLDHCKAPTLDKLFPQSYLDNYGNIPSLMRNLTEICSKTPNFSRLEKNILYLTTEKEQYRNCCMSEVTREVKDTKDSFSLTPCIEINQTSVNVAQKEFIVVSCQDGNSTKFVHNFHANIPTEGRLKPKIDNWKSQAGRPYSVFVLVIDSTSRAEMFRSLPLTTNYLLKTMNFVQFSGHHALGEPTLLNAMPMLMGIQRSTFQKEYFRFDEPTFWDSAPFIWRVFNELNYFTGYFEDDPEVGTFNYGGQLGFEAQPTTLYIRPLMLAHTRVTNRMNHLQYLEYCFGSKNVVEFMMDYHFRTLETLSEFPTFQITWPCWTQHDIGGSLSFLDTTYLDFFKKVFENKEIMDNTLFMVLSDHGFYSSMDNSYANTYESQIERRNMPLFIRLPDKLQAVYPDVQKNLEWNSKLITSHYDIYQTFLHIARMSGEFQPLSNLDTYGSSLLTRISETRTCKDARIPKTMCICNRPSSSSYSIFTESIQFDQFDTFE